jgi:hypothetical protein
VDNDMDSIPGLIKHPSTDRLQRALDIIGTDTSPELRKIMSRLDRLVENKIFRHMGGAWSLQSICLETPPQALLGVKMSVSGDSAYVPESIDLFNPSQAPKLELIAQELEEEYKKPQYSIRRSYPLEKMLLKKIEACDPKTVKKSASYVIPTKGIESFMEGMRFHASLSGNPPQITVALIPGSCSLIYTMPEKEAMERVDSLLPEGKNLPESVAVKCIVIRVQKLRNEINKIRTNPHNRDRDIQELPLDVNKEGLLKELDKMRSYRSVRNDPALKDLVRFLNRDDATESAVKAALNICKVHEVMES